MNGRKSITVALILALLSCPMRGGRCAAAAGLGSVAAAEATRCGCCEGAGHAGSAIDDPAIDDPAIKDMAGEETPLGHAPNEYPPSDDAPARKHHSNCVCGGAIVLASARVLAATTSEFATVVCVVPGLDLSSGKTVDARGNLLGGPRHFSREASGRDVRTCCASFLL